ncbi:hypothetical protein [Microbacterium schleiferi]|uniref:hypothetical protein n=1 Tax=Microbacterium schleiferi TaxID=69362 RepID=UPI001E2B53AC|nr:hypothetical protein [Microbacterium schleiferi]
MRIRSTKPEFWRSSRIASVGWDARLVLKGLESYVDDNGVGKDDLALIVGDVFPRDMLANPRDTLARVSEAISDLHQAGLIHRYEVDGTELLYISFWEDVQRIDKPGKGRFPRPDGTFDYKASVIRESVANPRESVAPGTGEQGNRGTGDFYSPSKSQSSSNRARVSTDAIHVPEMTRKLAARRGVNNIRSVVDAIVRHTGVTVDANGALQVALWILDKAKTAPSAPQRYVTGAITKNPLEVQQFIHENALGVA